VETIIRIGSCGAMRKSITLYDIIIAQGASTNSRYVDQFNVPGYFAPIADFGLVSSAKNKADEIGATTHVGNIFSSDIFYNADTEVTSKWARLGILGVEMESA